MQPITLMLHHQLVRPANPTAIVSNLLSQVIWPELWHQASEAIAVVAPSMLMSGMCRQVAVASAWIGSCDVCNDGSSCWVPGFRMYAM